MNGTAVMLLHRSCSYYPPGALCGCNACIGFRVPTDHNSAGEISPPAGEGGFSSLLRLRASHRLPHSLHWPWSHARTRVTHFHGTDDPRALTLATTVSLTHSCDNAIPPLLSCACMRRRLHKIRMRAECISSLVHQADANKKLELDEINCNLYINTHCHCIRSHERAAPGECVREAETM